MTRDGRVLRAWAISLALCGASGRTAAAQDQTAAYWAIVDEYIQGDPLKAVTAIEGVKAADLERAMRDLERLARDAKCKQCPARTRLEGLPVRGAFLLHSNADRYERAGRLVSNAPIDCSTGLQGRTAYRLLTLLGSLPEHKEFTVQATTAASLLLRAIFCPDAAEGWANLGLKSVPRSAVLFFVNGLAQETMGTQGLGPSPDQVGMPRQLGRAAAAIERDKRLRLEMAKDAFEKTIDLEPTFTEARVRLGRVLWRLGRLREARSALEGALKSAPPTLLYLAHLFLAQVMDDQGDVDLAIREYQAALTICPDSQMASVGIASALAIQGRMEEARAVLNLPAGRGRRSAVDPFWGYLTGGPNFPEKLFEGLRVDLKK